MTTAQIRTLSYAILLAALVSMTRAFQPDGKPNVYKPTIDRLLQEPLVLTPPPPISTVAVPAPESSTIPLVDDGPARYWFHPKIHTFGNIGPLGALHAGVAPLATKLIDVAAYDGENVRNQIARELSHLVVPFPTTTTTTTTTTTASRKSKSKSKKSHEQAPKIVDLACGVGISTRALQTAFPHAAQLVGIDTSPEMINMAKSLSNPKSWSSRTMELLSDWLFRANDMAPPPVSEEKGCGIEYNLANAEETGLESQSFDLATIMYCFHEAPYWGRSRILQEAYRLLAPGATLAIVDISPTYEPSFAMLAGEPYVLEYQENIQLQLKKAKGFQNCRYREVVEGHVGFWLLDREE